MSKAHGLLSLRTDRRRRLRKLSARALPSYMYQKHFGRKYSGVLRFPHHNFTSCVGDPLENLGLTPILFIIRFTTNFPQIGLEGFLAVGQILLRFERSLIGGNL